MPCPAAAPCAPSAGIKSGLRDGKPIDGKQEHPCPCRTCCCGKPPIVKPVRPAIDGPLEAVRGESFQLSTTRISCNCSSGSCMCVHRMIELCSSLCTRQLEAVSPDCFKRSVYCRPYVLCVKCNNFHVVCCWQNLKFCNKKKIECKVSLFCTLSLDGSSINLLLRSHYQLHHTIH